MNHRDRRCSFSHGSRATLDGAVPDIAGSEHAIDVRLQEEGWTTQLPSPGVIAFKIKVGTCKQVANLVLLKQAVKVPVRPRLTTNANKDP